MKEGATLCALKINHGQLEIWLETDGNELTQRRKLPTNEVVNVVPCHSRTENDGRDNIDYGEVSSDFLQMDLR
jgi:hypothetical protein